MTALVFAVRTRLMLAFHVLRGRPLMYRISLQDNRFASAKGTLVYECTFVGNRDIGLPYLGLDRAGDAGR